MPRSSAAVTGITLGFSDSFSSPQQKKTMECQLRCIMLKDHTYQKAILILTIVKYLPTNQRVPPVTSFIHILVRRILETPPAEKYWPSKTLSLCDCPKPKAHMEKSLYIVRYYGEMEPFNRLLVDR